MSKKNKASSIGDANEEYLISICLTFHFCFAFSGAPVRTLLVLDDDACPAELQACYPRGGSRFSIQMRRGGLVRVHDSVLMPNVTNSTFLCTFVKNIGFNLIDFLQSQYKSLLISERTTIDDLIELLLRCHGNNERIERFSIYEVHFVIPLASFGFISFFMSKLPIHF